MRAAMSSARRLSKLQTRSGCGNTADLDAKRTIDLYYKGIKVLFPAQISVNAIELKSADRKTDDRKISGNCSEMSSFCHQFLCQQPPNHRYRCFGGHVWRERIFHPPIDHPPLIRIRKRRVKNWRVKNG
jgi:hypothetical protein